MLLNLLDTSYRQKIPPLVLAKKKKGGGGREQISNFFFFLQGWSYYISFIITEDTAGTVVVCAVISHTSLLLDTLWTWLYELSHLFNVVFVLFNGIKPEYITVEIY